MAFRNRNRVKPFDVLRTDYEYCTIKYYVEGERNELGEPSHTLRQRGKNIKCSIDPIIRIPSYISQTSIRNILQQGIVEGSAYIMTLWFNQAVEPGDIVVDYDNVTYHVIQVINWYTHKEVYLKKIN